MCRAGVAAAVIYKTSTGLQEVRLHRAIRRRAAFLETAADAGCALRYREIDPDVFGEQLDLPGYEDVERIAAVGAVLSRAP